MGGGGGSGGPHKVFVCAGGGLDLTRVLMLTFFGLTAPGLVYMYNKLRLIQDMIQKL